VKPRTNTFPQSAGGEGDRRTTQMEQVARRVGRKWATEYRESLVQDHRAPTGGWPGTLTEARAVAHRSACADGARNCLSGLTAIEKELFARLINTFARSVWLNSATRDAPEPPNEETE
jgi:hypothetical protein